MYEAYFNLQKRPFSATPDPNCFFAPAAIQELLDQLVLRSDSSEGIGVVTGDAGTGKTLLCRRIAAELAPRMTPVFLANANFPTRRALLQSILFELGRKYSGLDEQELRLAIFSLLRELTMMGRGAVLIVDEAHLLSDRLLEEVRLLACLAEEDQPLARVILAGQAELEERLISPRLEALNQRIACHLYLEPLTRRESVEYVAYRISWAGGSASRLFTEEALDRIATVSAGLPRCLNQLCDHALLLTFVQEQERVTGDIVEEALLDLRQLPLHWNTTLPAEAPLDVLEPRVEDVDTDAEIAEETNAEMESGEPSPHSETVCFEVGGDDCETERLDDYSESISLADDDRRTVVATPEMIPLTAKTDMRIESSRGIGLRPVVAARTSQGPIEELVEDRYAMLDSGMPRLMRTFEDSPVPADWLPVAQSDVPTASLPIDLPRVPGVSEEYSVESLEEACGDAPELARLPTVEEQVSADLFVDETVDFLPEKSCDAILDAEPRLVDEMLEDVVLPADVRGYDVIEPELPIDRQSRHEHLREDRAPAGDASGRYVPRPKYRMIFSTLRRRLGRAR